MKSKLSFSPFPLLDTKRLSLQQISVSDAEDMLAIRSNPDVNRYLSRNKQPTWDETITYIQNNNAGIAENKWIMWGIRLKSGSGIIGTVCLWNFSEDFSTAELGYELLPDFQGKGIMREAVNCVLSFGFETLKLETITALTNIKNEASHKLLQIFKFSPQDSVKEEVLYYLKSNAFTV